MNNDAILKSAFIDAFFQDAYTDNESFSPVFERKMQKLINKNKEFYFSYINTIGKKVACTFLAVVIGLLVTVLSVEAVREPFLKFIVEKCDEFTSVFIKEKHSDINNNLMVEIIRPQYIPKGFAAENPSETATGYMCIYTNSNGKYFVYTQDIYDGLHITIDTENSTYEKLYINSLEAIYFENKGLGNIIFSNKDYIFNISGYLSKEEIIQIAESVKVD